MQTPRKEAKRLTKHQDHVLRTGQLGDICHLGPEMIEYSILQVDKFNQTLTVKKSGEESVITTSITDVTAKGIIHLQIHVFKHQAQPYKCWSICYQTMLCMHTIFVLIRSFLSSSESVK